MKEKEMNPTLVAPATVAQAIEEHPWPTSPEGRVEFTNVAVAVWRAHRATGGKKNDVNYPLVLVSFDAWKEAGTPMRSARKSSTGERTARTPQLQSNARFVHDGRPMPDSQNKLSSVAWYYTKGIVKGQDRLTVEEFKKYLAKLGVSEPNRPFKAVTMANGVVLSVVDETHGKVPIPEKAPKPAPVKAAAKKTTKAASPRKSTTKAPAKGRTMTPAQARAEADTAAKTAAKKAGRPAPASVIEPVAKRQVTPRPKAATSKGDASATSRRRNATKVA